MEFLHSKWSYILRWQSTGLPWMFCMRINYIFKRLVFFTDCGMLATPANGDVTFSSKGATTYMENATFSCNPGYTLTGDILRTCEASGNWGGASPTCNIKGRTYFNHKTYRYISKKYFKLNSSLILCTWLKSEFCQLKISGKKRNDQ